MLRNKNNDNIELLKEEDDVASLGTTFNFDPIQFLCIE